ncbi:cytochrome P450 family protein [Streptomyces sp. MH13]|uniref:cytochrome P450 family protein n=1 Tax=Streptomyces sp. MH13 TaxID=3417651 RepID=UPI003CEB8938
MLNSENSRVDVPEIAMVDPEVLSDPISAYGRAREQTPIVRLMAPGFGSIWAVTRHSDAKAMLSDPRLAMTADSWNQRIPDDVRPYMLTMSHMDGVDHGRLRKLAVRAFTARRAAARRDMIRQSADRLLDTLPGLAEEGTVDLLKHFAQPLPTFVVGDVMGIPEADRSLWRAYVARISSGGQTYDEALRDAIEGAKRVIELRREEPGDDLVSDLLRAQAEDADRISDTELVTMVWHTVFAGQDNLANFIANSVVALLSHPEQLAALRADPSLMPRAVEELMRWRPPLLLTAIRYVLEDFELCGAQVRAGDSVVAVIASANRDPRVFDDPDTLDITRPAGAAVQFGFGHGAHYCIGASLAAVEAEVAIEALLSRFPDLALAVPPDEVPRLPNPGSWHLTALPVTL